jgi:hypothetical protein
VGTEAFISFGEVTDQGLEVLLSNSVPLAGFQFDISGISVSSASGGAAESAGFQISNSTSTVLGFALTGATIPAGDHILFYLSGDATSDEGCLDNVILSTVGGDPFDVVVGDCTPLDYVEPIVTLAFGEVDSNSMDIIINSPIPVAGFQFDVSGIILSSTSGGIAEELGFSVSNNITGTVIGFSLTGTTIPAGEHVLTTLYFEALEEFACLDNVILSGVGGNALDYIIGDCTPLDYEPVIVDISLEMISENSMDILISCPVPLAGFQFDLEGVAILEASGGAAESAGFTISNSASTILGFSLTGATIPAGDYILTNIEFEAIDEQVCLSNVILSGAGGEGLDTNIGDCQDIPTGPEYELQHFTNLPAGTGISSLVIIQDALDLEVGDEIGLFDGDAILNSGDCSSQTGELLIGAGVWTGEQLEIVGVGSVDNCAFGGFQLPGYQNSNKIIYRVWKASDNEVYPAEVTYAAGTGVWGELLTAISMLEPVFSVTQEVELNPYMYNFISTNLSLEDTEISSILSDNDVLIAANDAGQYYVPGFGVDQIGSIDITRGLFVFPTSEEMQTIMLEGLPAPFGPITINPFQVNLISYLPQECMSTDDVFAGYEDQILLVQNDAGGFYVPSFGVMSLTEMCPGDGYSIFLSGANGFDFTYPMGGMARSSASFAWESYNEASASVMYADDIVKTGISHPIILTSLEGMVEPGDELVAYADGHVVGATRVVDSSMPIVLSAWGSYTEYGANLPGYVEGDAIELRLYSLSEGRELYVESDLDGAYYGSTPLTSGTGVVLTSSAVPMAYDLMQNYPSPFNPSTTIGFSVPESAHVTLSIYDMTGRLVTTLVDGTVDMGVHMVEWSGENSSGSMVSAGVYIYALESADTIDPELSSPLHSTM